MKKEYYKYLSLFLFVIFVLSEMGKTSGAKSNVNGHSLGAVLADITFYILFLGLIAFLFWLGDRETEDDK